MTTGYQLPLGPDLVTGQGFVTPRVDKTPQILTVLPARVIPIVFLPGIMGSNLRLKPDRQRALAKTNNIAWRPEHLAEAAAFLNADAPTRQRQLDPDQTEVDRYDPDNNPTGNPNETADERNSEVNAHPSLDVAMDSPLLKDDPPNAKPRRTKHQKARERGWGEVKYDSYSRVLEMCEERLFRVFSNGQLDEWWRQVVDVDPAEWQAHPGSKLKPLTQAELKEAVKGCWFPAHAMGYNWLQSNAQSGGDVADRITQLIAGYKARGFKCEKVILVTHSMGGLVARAVIHPQMGNAQDKVLGIVHGVMPATGAAAAYKRMRCGFEDEGLLSTAPIASITAKVLGNHGNEVTAVLGNAQGGLELLPSQAYGNDWLHVTHRGTTEMNLPQKGDPYEEIYKVKDKWYGLLIEDWINPAKLDLRGWKNTMKLLEKAKAFHKAIEHTYHPVSYAHYGADLTHAAWHRVEWRLDARAVIRRASDLSITADNRQGKLTTQGEGSYMQTTSFPSMQIPDVQAVLQPARDPGDQTVPAHSADHQLLSGKFAGVFRQTGYEHQDSYLNERALKSTLYSIVRIAQHMKWTPA